MILKDNGKIDPCPTTAKAHGLLQQGIHFTQTILFSIKHACWYSIKFYLYTHVDIQLSFIYKVIWLD